MSKTTSAETHSKWLGRMVTLKASKATTFPTSCSAIDDTVVLMSGIDCIFYLRDQDIVDTKAGYRDEAECTGEQPWLTKNPCPGR